MTPSVARPPRPGRHATGRNYLATVQAHDGHWSPLWFGNQHRKEEDNPTYGTSRVLRASDPARGDTQPATPPGDRVAARTLKTPMAAGVAGGRRRRRLRRRRLRSNLWPAPYRLVAQAFLPVVRQTFLSVRRSRRSLNFLIQSRATDRQECLSHHRQECLCHWEGPKPHRPLTRESTRYPPRRRLADRAHRPRSLVRAHAHRLLFRQALVLGAVVSPDLDGRRPNRLPQHIASTGRKRRINPALCSAKLRLLPNPTDLTSRRMPRPCLWHGRRSRRYPLTDPPRGRIIPNVPKFRIDALGDLARQMEFTPQDARLRKSRLPKNFCTRSTRQRPTRGTLSSTASPATARGSTPKTCSPASRSSMTLAC